MNKFRINELTPNNDGNGTNNSHHHGIRSPSSLPLASSSTTSTQERLSANNVAAISEEPRARDPIYQAENNFILPSHNINWRDEADGSEEEECRLNIISNPTSTDGQSNLQSSTSFSQHSNLLPHQVPLFPNVIEQDLHCQSLNINSADSTRVTNTNKNLDSNFKEKHLRDTAIYIDRIEDLLSSFKNLLKSNESNDSNCTLHDNVNINSNANSSNSKLPQTVVKMTNNSNNNSFSHPNYSRVSNQFVNNSANMTIPKNTHLMNELTDDASRNDKNNRKFAINNRHLVQNDSQPLLNNNNNSGILEGDFIHDMSLNENQLGSEARIDQFYRLINSQVNALRKRLEQIALAADIKENHYFQNNLPNDCYSNSNQPFFNEYPSCDSENCCRPSDFNFSAESNNSQDDLYFRSLNQQIYQLLLFQNNQITQQNQLIQSWLNSLQKWFEKDSRNQFASHNISRDTSSNSANNLFFNDIAPINHSFSQLNNKANFVYPSDRTLNNQTEPRGRTNNFWDNFRSHSYQNKLQTNRDLSFTRDHYNEGHHGSGNCSNSCSNVGPCNKNNRSQAFTVFSSNNSQKNQPNNFALNQQQVGMPSNSSNYNSIRSGNSMPSMHGKKQNTNMDSNVQQLSRLMSMVEKIAETDLPSNAFNTSNQHFNANVNFSNSRLNFPAQNSIIQDSKGGCKRKKVSNMSSSDIGGPFESQFQEISVVPELENDDDHDSIDMEEPSPFDQIQRTNNGNANEVNVFNGPSASDSPNVPTSLPFQMDKCNFQVPLTISPHTGAIRKKPLYDCNFKFAATDTQKLSMQNHTQIEKSDSCNPNSVYANSSNLDLTSSENVRPLMPAEGRSSEQFPNVSSAVLTLKPKLPNSSQKYSTRPPITGAGNESTSIKSVSSSFINAPSGQESLNNSLDDDIKWNKLNGNDMQNNVSAENVLSNENNVESHEEATDLACNGNTCGGDCLTNDSDVSSTELSDGSPLIETQSNGKKEAANKIESSFIVPFLNGAHSNSNPLNASHASSMSVSNSALASKSNPAAELEANHNNGVENGINGVNGRFHHDVDVVRVNGQHNGNVNNNNDDDLDDDTDVRLLSLAGNGGEVRTTVRLSGDGEQGL